MSTDEAPDRDLARRTLLELIERERRAAGLPDNRQGRRAAERRVRAKIKEFTRTRERL